MDPKDLISARPLRHQGGELTDSEEYSGLYASIQQRLKVGKPPIVEPIQYYVEDDQKIIRAGHTRVQIALELGIEDVPVVRVPRPTDDLDDLTTRMLTNMHRQDLNPIEIAEALQEMVDAGLKQNQIAEQLGEKEAWVSTHLAQLTLEQPLKDAVADGRLSARAGYEATQISPAMQRDHAGDIIGAKTVRRVQGVRRTLAEMEEQFGDDPPPEPPPEIPPQEVHERDLPAEMYRNCVDILCSAHDMIVRAREIAEQYDLDISEKLLEVEAVCSD